MADLSKTQNKVAVDIAALREAQNTLLTDVHTLITLNTDTIANLANLVAVTGGVSTALHRLIVAPSNLHITGEIKHIADRLDTVLSEYTRYQ